MERPLPPFFANLCSRVPSCEQGTPCHGRDARGMTSHDETQGASSRPLCPRQNLASRLAIVLYTTCVPAAADGLVPAKLSITYHLRHVCLSIFEGGEVKQLVVSLDLDSPPKMNERRDGPGNRPVFELEFGGFVRGLHTCFGRLARMPSSVTEPGCLPEQPSPTDPANVVGLAVGVVW